MPGIAIAAFMQQEFHKNTSSLDISINAMDPANNSVSEVEVDRVVHGECLMPYIMKHTLELLYTKCKCIPTLCNSTGSSCIPKQNTGM